MKTIGAGALLKDLCAKLDPVGIYDPPPSSGISYAKRFVSSRFADANQSLLQQ